MSTDLSAEVDVLCVGIITIDHVCAPLKRLPSPGELEMTRRIEPCIGGSAANTGLDLRRLGRSVSVACRVGNDFLGQHVAKVLADEGACCEQVQFSTTVTTATTMVVNVRGEDRRFIHDAGANAEFTGREIELDVVKKARAICVSGFGLNAALTGENVARLFAAAREAGVLTVLDVVVGEEDVNAMLAPVLPLTDLFFPNEDEGRAITGLSDPVEQAQSFRQRGATRVVVTRGAQGAILVDEQQTITIEAHPIEQIDATGGGDAFVAGFVHAALEGHSPEMCLRFGSALGASCVRAAGATAGVFRAEELAEFVRTHPLELERILQR